MADRSAALMVAQMVELTVENLADTSVALMVENLADKSVALMVVNLEPW